jgi:hypothetical protein
VSHSSGNNRHHCAPLNRLKLSFVKFALAMDITYDAIITAPIDMYILLACVHMIPMAVEIYGGQFVQ